MKKFYILVVLLVLFIFNPLAYSKMVKVAVVSDIHVQLAKKDNGEYKMTPSIRNLQRAIANINESDFDYVVFTGDCIDSANKESLVMFGKIINALKKPYYVIMGNHDVVQVTGVDKKKFFQLVNRFSKNKTRKLPAIKVVDNKLVFFFMDGVNQFIPGPKGSFKEDELLWLDKKLNKYKNQNVLIFQHFPIVEPMYHPSHKTVNADEYLEVLSKHNNVRAIITGHYHFENEIIENDIMHISVPALVEDAQYKELDIEYDIFDKDFEIRTKMHDAI